MDTIEKAYFKRAFIWFVVFAILLYVVMFFYPVKISDYLFHLIVFPIYIIMSIDLIRIIYKKSEGGSQ